MRAEYEFQGGSRGAILPAGSGKTRITIRIDEDVLAWFRAGVEDAGGGSYQAAINAALREHVQRAREPLEATLRRVIREEMASYRAG